MARIGAFCERRFPVLSGKFRLNSHSEVLPFKRSPSTSTAARVNTSNFYLPLPIGALLQRSRTAYLVFSSERQLMSVGFQPALRSALHTTGFSRASASAADCQYPTVPGGSRRGRV